MQPDERSVANRLKNVLVSHARTVRTLPELPIITEDDFRRLEDVPFSTQLIVIPPLA